MTPHSLMSLIHQTDWIFPRSKANTMSGGRLRWRLPGTTASFSSVRREVENRCWPNALQRSCLPSPWKRPSKPQRFIVSAGCLAKEVPFVRPVRFGPPITPSAMWGWWVVPRTQLQENSASPTMACCFWMNCRNSNAPRLRYSVSLSKSDE